MTPKLPHAAKVLLAEVQEIDQDTTFEGDNIDGLGVYRALHMYTGDNLGIAEALSRVSAFDRRIMHVDCDDQIVTVTFPGDQIVWSRARFGVKDIYTALGDEWAGEMEKPPMIVDVHLPGDKPAKKATAKKAAKKSSTSRRGGKS